MLKKQNNQNAIIQNINVDNVPYPRTGKLRSSLRGKSFSVSQGSVAVAQNMPIGTQERNVVSRTDCTIGEPAKMTGRRGGDTIDCPVSMSSVGRPGGVYTNGSTEKIVGSPERTNDNAGKNVGRPDWTNGRLELVSSSQEWISDYQELVNNSNQEWSSPAENKCSLSLNSREKYSTCSPDRISGGATEGRGRAFALPEMPPPWQSKH